MKQVVIFLKQYAKVTGLFVLTITSFVFAMFQGGFLSWFLFYTFLPFGLYSFLLIGYPLHLFKVDRIINKNECRAGESVEAGLSLSRKNLFPLFYLIVEEVVPAPLTSLLTDKKKTIIFPWFKKEIKLNYRFDHLPRGEHLLHIVRLQTGDFLGLYQKTAYFVVPQRILVYPAYFDLPSQQLENAYDQGNVGSVRKLQHEHTLATGVREYQPGDQISWINWKATAKKNEMMTKEFDEQKSHDLCLILDEQHTELFEEMVTFSASFAHAILKKGIQIGYLGTANQEPPLPIRGGDSQRKSILYRLAQAKTTPSDEHGLSLGDHQAAWPLNAALIIVTSQLTRSSVDLISTYKLNRAVTVFCIKKGSFLTADEISLRQAAQIRGIRVKYLDHQQFDSGVVEVMAQ